MTDWSWPRVVLSMLVLAVLLTLVIAGSTTTEAFGTYNPGWEGSTTIRELGASTGASVEIITETTPYTQAQPGSTVIIAIAPSDQYDDQDLARIRSFVRAGGMLVVAEDVGGGGNRLLSGVGAETRFDNKIVRDLRFHGPTAEMPLATEVSPDPLTRNVETVMLNNGTTLVTENETGSLIPLGSSNATRDASVLISTSSYSVVDSDGDGDLDDERLQSYPVMAVETVGNGRVVAVSDASLFINSMQDEASNQALVSAILTGHERILLDYSHAEEQPPVWMALQWLRQTPEAVALSSLLGLLALELLVRRTRRSVT
ncbi:DUF4350 domain-containing protein [Salinigranum halophilum]|uniref:DUF4350 domain-containing protein n=1 Tax=Salinigranum halophilum TaxID=2565931 RepID=UPI001375A000|nr:DUF4350 domain-containing protein [Salinigranum halophilum]